MSLETASKLLNEINVEELKNKSKEEIELFIKEKGYDCSMDELEKAFILANPLSEEELSKVAGGLCAKEEYFFDGKCSKDFYVEACTDTVEPLSNCYFGDYKPGKYTCTYSSLRCTGGNVVHLIPRD